MDGMHFELHFNCIGMHFKGKMVDFVMKTDSFCWHMVDFVGIRLILRSSMLIDCVWNIFLHMCVFAL